MKTSINRSCLLFLVLLLLSACAKPTTLDVLYSKNDLMNVYWNSLEQSEINFQIYREGAAGLSGNKGHGGCGCN